MAEDSRQDIERLEKRLHDVTVVRRGFLAHLGESVYALVRSDPALRVGREEVLDAIAACDVERARTEDLLAAAEARAFAREQTAEAAGDVDTTQAIAVPEESHDDADALTVESEVEPVVETEPVVEVEPEVTDASEAVTEKLEVQDTIRLSLRDETPTQVLETREAEVAAEASETEAQAFCPVCGAPVKPAHKFCMSCGNRLR